ncbi:hypothetical protein Bbelb_379420 [Branchiostoma belcheri]|nr:hypothetical protein Bbelb_379420 [Branchiostoma belcheri]
MKDLEDADKFQLGNISQKPGGVNWQHAVQQQDTPFLLVLSLRDFSWTAPMQLIMCTLLWAWQTSASQHGRDATPPLTEQRPGRSVDITASNLYHPLSFPTHAGHDRDIVLEDVVVDQSFNLPGLTDLEYLEYSGHKFITMVTGDGKAEVYMLNITTGHFNWTAELDISGESVKQLRYFSAASNCFGEDDPDVRLYCAVLSDYTPETPVQTLHFSSQTRGLHLFHTPQEGPTDPLFLLVLLEKGAMLPTGDGGLTVPVYRWQSDKHYPFDAGRRNQPPAQTNQPHRADQFNVTRTYQPRARIFQPWDGAIRCLPAASSDR